MRRYYNNSNYKNINTILSHLLLRRLRRGVLGRVHHVLLDHGIHNDLRPLDLLLRLAAALALGLVGLAGLDVGHILLLLCRRLRVNRRRGGGGFLLGLPL